MALIDRSIDRSIDPLVRTGHNEVAMQILFVTILVSKMNTLVLTTTFSYVFLQRRLQQFFLGAGGKEGPD